MARRAVIALISLYQKTLSPDHSRLGRLIGVGACRYQPTCSEYTKEAVAKYGVMKGVVLGLRRVGRCHPLGGHGYDPVP